MFLKTDQHVIQRNDISYMDVSRLEELIVDITMKDGTVLQATDLHAIELVMSTKPSAFEGVRLRWPKLVWAFHNLIAHPLMHILIWLRLHKWAFQLHDGSIPRPIGKRISKSK